MMKDASRGSGLVRALIVAAVLFVPIVLLTGAVLFVLILLFHPEEPLKAGELRGLVKGHTGLTLPDSARDLHFHELSVMTAFVYVRFELAPDDLRRWMDEHEALPSFEELAFDAEQRECLITAGRNLWWWRVDEVPSPRFGRKSQVRRYPKGNYWEWTFHVVTQELGENLTRVYLYVSTDTAPRPTETRPAVEKAQGSS